MARKISVKSKTQTINQIKALLVTAPDRIRQHCYVSSPAKCVKACEALKTKSNSYLDSSLISMLQLLVSCRRFLSAELKDIEK